MLGLCIKYFNENYGGMLQAYATIKILENQGLDYEIIRYQKKYTPLLVLKFLPRLLNGVLLSEKKEQFNKKNALKKRPKFAENEAVRFKAFDTFRKEKFVKLSPVFNGYNELCLGAKRYSAVITGSDQLWSPSGLPTNFYNLMFVPDDIVKISYASSFGVKKIPWYQMKRTTRFLKRIEHISMRENRGSEIVKELTGRDVPTILDPVFMFDALGWEKLIPVKKEIEEPYIFAYFLGSDPEHRRAVKESAKELGCKIVALRHLDQYVAEDETLGDIALYDVGPDRFLNLIRGATYVCTDSFHGACFSIIHKKQFVIFNRYCEGTSYSKNSRIDTLCDNLKLQERRYGFSDDLSERLQKEIDYAQVIEKINVLKKNTDLYLDNALKGVY